VDGLILRLERALAAHTPLDLAADRPDLRPAGVLVPIVERAGAPHLVFTKRTSTVEHHKGQVSFPGGGMEPGDTDLRATALREADEEVGIHSARVLGALDQMVTTSGFRVAPFVAVLPPELRYAPQAAEVEQVIEIPFAAVAAGFGLREVEWRGRSIESYAVEWRAVLVWGVTGWILRTFLVHAAPELGLERDSGARAV